MNNTTGKADTIIAAFGGPYTVAKILSEAEGRKVSASAVYRWTYPRYRGGTDGFIPRKHKQALRSMDFMAAKPLSDQDWSEA